MTSSRTLARARARLSTEAKRAGLELRRRRTAGDLFIDYGWIKLLYSGDSDYQEIAYHKQQEHWHAIDINVFRSLISPGQTVVDVGANMGVTTVMLASLVGPRGRVISFEPSPVIFKKLEKTIAANRLEQVVAKNIGCGAAPAAGRLHRVGRSSGNSSILATGSGSVEIRIERLDDVPEVRAGPVSLLKIDTEGYEPEVLRGAEQMIRESKPIIYLEMGGDYIPSTLESIALLAAAGYGTEHVRSVDWTEIGNGSDFFFLPKRA